MASKFSFIRFVTIQVTISIIVNIILKRIFEGLEVKPTA